MLTSVRMKKFYLAVAKRYETQVLEGIASLGAAQLTSARELVGGEADSADLYDRFLRAEQKCKALSESVSALLARYGTLVSRDTQAAGSGSPQPRVSMRISKGELAASLAGYETRLDGLGREVDRLLGDADALAALGERLSILHTAGVGTDALGRHTFTVVKAGLVGEQALPKLEEALRALKAVYEAKRAKPGESILVVAAPMGSEKDLDEALARSGFQEVEATPGLDPDPEAAAKEVEERLKRRLKDSAKLQAGLQELGDELEARAEYVSFLRDSTTVLSRTNDLSVTEGWVVSGSVQALRDKVATITSGAYYLQVEEPRSGEATPVLLQNKGWFLKGFELLTSIRGVPSYNETDPTLIFALLFPVMYGMMFGDVGDGLVIAALGFLLYRRKKSMIGISAHALRSLGTIMIVGGFSGVVFGFLYGSVFLFHIGPLLFEPVSAFTTIIEVALAFGVLQLTISLLLNIRNNASRGDIREAVFSGKGAVGLAYYLIGIVLAVRLIQGGLQFSLFLAPENLPFTAGALLCLVIVFLSPAIRGIGRAEGQGLGESITEGIGEFIEVFISFITNSLSYLRLAAFAIAHGIFAGFASDLGSSVGVVASFVLVNALVIVVEGFAVGIQSVRLLYYEFSTKFFAGEGQRFKPLSLKLTEPA